MLDVGSGDMTLEEPAGASVAQADGLTWRRCREKKGDQSLPGL